MINHRLIRQSRRVMHLLHLTLLRITHIRHVRHCGDDIHIKLTIQSFLDNLHVQQSQESATESEAQSYRTLWRECQRSIVKLQFLQRCTKVLIVCGIYRIHTCKHHRLHLLESLDGSITRSSHLSDGITHLHLLGVLDTGDDISHIASTQFLTRHHIHLQHSHLVGIILHSCIEELHVISLTDDTIHDLEVCDDSSE